MTAAIRTVETEDGTLEVLTQLTHWAVARDPADTDGLPWTIVDEHNETQGWYKTAPEAYEVARGLQDEADAEAVAERLSDLRDEITARLDECEDVHTLSAILALLSR